MEIDPIIKLISNLGFPIVVAGWLMFTQTRILKRFDALIKDLLELLEKK